MKKLTAFTLSILLLLSFILTGCHQDNEKSELNKTEEKKIQIGMSFDSFVIERWQRDRDVFVSMAKELGAEVNVQNANGDIAEQKKQIEYFIEKAMDVIVIICIDSDSLRDTVKKAKDAGIKVIAYDRLITNADVDLYISFDNEMVGEMMAKELVKSGLTDKKVLMLCGSPTDYNVPLVEKGFRRIMLRNGNEILDTVYAEGWRAEIAGEYIYKNMNIVNQADAIMCGNDNLASSVVYALSEKRMAGKKLVTGQDADLEACQRIVEGTQLMTVYKPIEKLAQTAAEYAVALAEADGDTAAADFLSSGNNEAGSVTTVFDGTYNVPYLKIDPVCVTADNIDEVIIKSGFHLKEDVYLNVPNKMPE